MNRARFSLLLFMTIFVCLLNTPLFSQSMEKNMEATDESQIKMLYNEMCRAMISKDMEEMERIHAESFVLIHMTGSKMNKKEYLEAVKDGTLNYYSADLDEITVNVSGNHATVCAKSRVNAAVYGGGRHTWRLQQDMTAEKIGGKWQFTHSRASTY